MIQYIWKFQTIFCIAFFILSILLYLPIREYTVSVPNLHILRFFLFHLRRKITVQTVLAFLLIVFGMTLVMLALFMPPKGEIHPSVITVFGMILVAAGAFLGIDLNFQLKSYINSLKEAAILTQNVKSNTPECTDLLKDNKNETI